MFRFLQRSSAVAFGFAVFAAADAQAVRVDFSVPNDTTVIEMDNGTDATATLDIATDFVDLTPGVTETFVFISPGEIDVSEAIARPAVNDDPESLTRPLTAWIGSGTPVSHDLSQPISVVTRSGDFGQMMADVFIGDGSPVVYNLGSYELTVTPRFFQRTGQTSAEIGLTSHANFLLTAVPESTSGLFLLAGVGLLMSHRPRRV